MNQNTGKLMGICISDIKGIQKSAVDSAVLVENHGIAQDAHAGDWPRQVSLLSYEKIQEFNARGAEVIDGAFGENLIVSGIDLAALPVGTHMRCGDTELEVTQIGKECHNDGCAIKKQTGECVMPLEGIFTIVIEEGVIKPGDEIELLS